MLFKDLEKYFWSGNIILSFSGKKKRGEVSNFPSDVVNKKTW